FIHRMDKIRGLIVAGSLATSILASIVLAGFASIVELPCTAGFPVIYTNILAEKGFDNNLGYYFYLLLYNMVYVIQESTLVIIFGFFFAGKRSHSISEKQVQWLKLAGGIIMLALGIILLVNPNLLNLVK
ncbi:cytochrome C biosynthesis protein, partial [bacterium]|nr:cytochrome C biosynthesis protein [bacterium]